MAHKYQNDSVIMQIDDDEMNEVSTVKAGLPLGSGRGGLRGKVRD